MRISYFFKSVVSLVIFFGSYVLPAQSVSITNNGSPEEGVYNISVSDDGKGFDHKHVENAGGLKNIKSRVEYLQGEFEIDSSLGNGSHIFVRVK